MGYCYILRCADGTFYVGSTVDLSQRLEQHAQGMGSAYTKRRLPVALAWSDEFPDVGEAFRWEKRIQGWSHAKRAAFIEGGLDAVLGWSARERSRNSESVSQPGRRGKTGGQVRGPLAALHPAFASLDDQ